MCVLQQCFVNHVAMSEKQPKGRKNAAGDDGDCHSGNGDRTSSASSSCSPPMGPIFNHMTVMEMLNELDYNVEDYGGGDNGGGNSNGNDPLLFFNPAAVLTATTAANARSTTMTTTTTMRAQTPPVLIPRLYPTPSVRAVALPTPISPPPPLPVPPRRTRGGLSSPLTSCGCCKKIKWLFDGMLCLLLIMAMLGIFATVVVTYVFGKQSDRICEDTLAGDDCDVDNDPRNSTVYIGTIFSCMATICIGSLCALHTRNQFICA